jgi:hypothetical protein
MFIHHINQVRLPLTFYITNINFLLVQPFLLLSARRRQDYEQP